MVVMNLAPRLQLTHPALESFDAQQRFFKGHGFAPVGGTTHIHGLGKRLSICAMNLSEAPQAFMCAITRWRCSSVIWECVTLGRGFVMPASPRPRPND
jgi:hypothetical protein